MEYGYSYISGQLADFEYVSVIGKSTEGRDIYCIQIGKGPSCAVFAAAFHALEYLTAAALLDFARSFSSMTEYHDRVKVYIVPMVNPDGAEIAINGINPQLQYHKDIIKNTGIIDFCDVWQANASGVDINHNFNADWKSIYSAPAPSKFGGEYPESEPETRAVTMLLRRVMPELFIAFHSQGKEIYYDFNGLENKLAQEHAELIAEEVGYRACSPQGTAGFGGAKDWYIQEYSKEAFTVELGMGKNPLPHAQLDEMKNDTFKICKGFIDCIF